MKTSDFSFELPEDLIAQYPPDERGQSRLFELQRPHGEGPARYGHHVITDLPKLLPPDTLMVFNNSRVRKARLYGNSAAGGRVEFLLLEKKSPATWLCMVSKARKQKPGKSFSFPGGVSGTILEVQEPYRLVQFSDDIGDPWLDRHGHIPLPPYIKRPDEAGDARRYQTVFAEKSGSVAAPTAGLHFTEDILDGLDRAGIRRCYVTLHVGLGTFLPVRSDDLREHTMHREHYDVPAATAEAVNAAKREGRPVLAVGTTSVRTLESAWDGEKGLLAQGEGSTDIFIYPGYRFQVPDMLFTNFHTPESTLLMLVSAFAGQVSGQVSGQNSGRDIMLEAYREAVRHSYRFFSYGDAMLIR